MVRSGSLGEYEMTPTLAVNDEQLNGCCDTVIVPVTSLLDLVHSHTPNHTMHIQPFFVYLNFQGHILLI